MADFRVLGGAVSKDPIFHGDMNAHYATVDDMKASVVSLKQAGLDVATMEFGQYQPVLEPNAIGKLGAGWWQREVTKARTQLSAQANTTPLSRDEPKVIPPTKCALLDACVQKCFKSNEPIPMTIKVNMKKQTDADLNQHDIVLDWVYEVSSDVPKRLYLTMVCPYEPSPAAKY